MTHTHTHTKTTRAARAHRTKSTSNLRNPLDTYFAEVSRTPLLTPEQEINLAYAIKFGGDTKARDHMIRANLRIVITIARRHIGRGVAFADLIAEGNIGLMRAVEGYDPSRNVRFSTYAQWWIVQAIQTAIANTGRTIRIPKYMKGLLVKWKRATARLLEELGRQPSNEEIAESIGLPKKKLKIVMRALGIHEAVQETCYTQGRSDETEDEKLMDCREAAPDAAMELADEWRKIEELIDKMDEREARVLKARFGLDGQEAKSLKAVGEAVGVTRERVRQIERDALRKLRECVAG